MNLKAADMVETWMLCLILANFKEDEAEEIKKQEEDSFNLGYDY